MIGLVVLALSGCVTSQYVDKQGRSCTRKFFTPLGITTHQCGEQIRAVAVPEAAAPAPVPTGSSAQGLVVSAKPIQKS